jgi:hypothetical protein
VNLNTGAIGNAVTRGDADSVHWNLNSGRGEFCPDGSFEVSNFSGNALNTDKPNFKLDSPNTLLTGTSSYITPNAPITDGEFQLGLSDPVSQDIGEKISMPIAGNLQ